MMTGNSIRGPFAALLSFWKGEVFRRFEGGMADLTQAKVVFVAINLVGVCFALWKLNNMGLLPVTAADWTFLVKARDAVEVRARLSIPLS